MGNQSDARKKALAHFPNQFLIDNTGLWEIEKSMNADHFSFDKRADAQLKTVLSPLTKKEIEHYTKL